LIFHKSQKINTANCGFTVGVDARLAERASQ
jgi:hypothetical protein